MIHNIQVLRAFAAIAVLFHHSIGQYDALGGQIEIFKFLANWGFFGVDVFFVISGFVICHTTFNKERDIKNAINFLKLRVFRVYLGYWPFFIVSFFIIYYSNSQNLGDFNIAGSFLLIEPNMFKLVLPVTWSLTYELYFYLIFFVFFAFNSKVVRFLIPVILSVLFLRVIFLPIDPSSVLNFFISPFLIEFFLGALLYLFYDRIKRKLVLYIAMLLAFFSFALGVYLDAKSENVRVFTAGIGSFFIVLSALLLEKLHVFKAKGIIVNLGDSSYSLYLSHLIFLQIFYFSGLRSYLFDNGLIIAEIGFFLYLLLVILLSHFYYKLVEIRVYKFARNVSFVYFLGDNRNRCV